jgi:guanylate kinase
MKKMILLVGAAGSGKTYLRDVFQFESVVTSHTTRAKRPNEKHGKDYYFEKIKDKQMFLEKNVEKQDIIAFTFYRDELYYCKKSDFYEKDKTTLKSMFIVDPAGVLGILEAFPESGPKNQRFSEMFNVVVLEVKDRTRMKNLYHRGIEMYLDNNLQEDGSRLKKVPFTKKLKIAEDVLQKIKQDLKNFKFLDIFAEDFQAKIVKL